jgi:hypothetical protein
MDKTSEKEVLDFFMDDSSWLRPKDGKQIDQKKTDDINIITSQKAQTRNEEEIIEKQYLENEEIGFGEVDYAILKSITYGFKEINEISNALQIRNLVVEKHIFKHIKEGFIKYFQFCVLTSRGKNAIEEYEINNPEDIWKPIVEFIVTVIERKKERSLKIQKIVDIVLLIAMIILIILIFYFGFF